MLLPSSAQCTMPPRPYSLPPLFLAPVYTPPLCTTFPLGPRSARSSSKAAPYTSHPRGFLYGIVH